MTISRPSPPLKESDTHTHKALILNELAHHEVLPAPFLCGVLWEFSPTLTISRICNSSSQSCHHPALLCHYNDTDTSCIVCDWRRTESSTMAWCWSAVGKVGPQVQTWGQSPALDTGCKDPGHGYVTKNTTPKTSDGNEMDGKWK